MSIEVTCSECSETLEVPEKFLGKSLRCPTCKAPVRVPAGKNGSSSPMSIDDDEEDAEEQESRGRPSPKSAPNGKKPSVKSDVSIDDDEDDEEETPRKKTNPNRPSSKPPAKAKRRQDDDDDEDDDEDERPRKKKAKKSQGNSGMVIALVAVGVLAIGGAVGGGIYLMNKDKKDTRASTDKPSETSNSDGSPKMPKMPTRPGANGPGPGGPGPGGPARPGDTGGGSPTPAIPAPANPAAAMGTSGDWQNFTVEGLTLQLPGKPAQIQAPTGGVPAGVPLPTMKLFVLDTANRDARYVLLSMNLPVNIETEQDIQQTLSGGMSGLNKMPSVGPEGIAIKIAIGTTTDIKQNGFSGKEFKLVEETTRIEVALGRIVVARNRLYIYSVFSPALSSIENQTKRFMTSAKITAVSGDSNNVAGAPGTPGRPPGSPNKPPPGGNGFGQPLMPGSNTQPGANPGSGQNGAPGTAQSPGPGFVPAPGSGQPVVPGYAQGPGGGAPAVSQPPGPGFVPAPGSGQPVVPGYAQGPGTGAPGTVQPPAGPGTVQPPGAPGAPGMGPGGGPGRPPGGGPGRPPGGGPGRPPGGPAGPGRPGGPGMNGPGGNAPADHNPPPQGANTDGIAKHKIDAFFTAAFDPEKKAFFTITARVDKGKTVGTLTWYSYPNFETERTFKIPHLASRAVIDPAKGLLYIATIANGANHLKQQFDLIAAQGDIQVFDLEPVYSKSAAPNSDLKPLATYTVNKTIRGMELTEEGKYLVVATHSTTSKPPSTLMKFDTETRKPEIKTCKEPIWEMRKSADGKSLLILNGVHGSILKSTLMVYNPDTLTEAKETAELDGIGNYLASVPGSARGQIAITIAGAGPNPAKLTMAGEGGKHEIQLGIGWRACGNSPSPGYVEFSPDGKQMFMSAFNASGLDVFDVGDIDASSGLSALTKKASIRTAGGANQYVGGQIFVSPDGLYVIDHHGIVIETSNVGGSNGEPVNNGIAGQPGQAGQPMRPGGIPGQPGGGFAGPGGGPGGAPAFPGGGPGPGPAPVGPGGPNKPPPPRPPGAGGPGSPNTPGTPPVAPGAPGAPGAAPPTGPAPMGKM